MRKQQNPPVMSQLAILVALIFFIIIGISINTEYAGAVTSASGTNATMLIFDDGDRDLSVSNRSPGLEVNNLFNDTSNVYFFANYTNGTSASMVSQSGTECSIEFEKGAGGNIGPFSMTVNNSLNLFEYNRSFPQNGTFAWNVTCQNTAAGTAAVRAYDNVRIFGPGCSNLSGASFPNSLTNNTILCGGNVTLTPGAGQTALAFSNNNITLDCNRTIIRGATLRTGITLGVFNGSIVKNCIFENYTDIVVTATTHKDYLVLFNNSFANATNGINLTVVGNITVEGNNFTNITQTALYASNVTNWTVRRNRFCDNGKMFDNTTTTSGTVDNNTMCVNLVSPANNTNQNSTNFTFNVPSFGLARTCDLITVAALSGRITVEAANESNVNVTSNRTGLHGTTFNWQVNCTDTSNNAGLSLLFNSTQVDVTPPAVTNIRPSPTQTAARVNGTVINISATVTDNGVRDTVLVNITYPNNTTKEQLVLTNVTTTYNFSFANTTARGVYNITFIANDTAGNINATEITNFTIDDASPVVTKLSPTSGAEGDNINYTATVTDNIGVLTCNLFAGTSSNSTTNYGAMNFDSTINITSRGFAIGTYGTYVLYANCTDASGNHGFNFTTVTISIASSGGGPRAGPTGVIGAATGISASGAAAGAAAAEAAEEGDKKEEEEEEEEEVVVETPSLEYGINIKSVIVNNNVVYENGEQIDVVAIKDYDLIEIITRVSNIKNGTVEGIQVKVSGLPEGINITRMSPEIIESISPGEEKEVIIELESGDVQETFIMNVAFIAEKATTSIQLNTFLEAEKGKLYSQRQKIIEETKAVLIRTYKILFLLFLIPILLLLRATTVVDERALRRMIEDKKVNEYWRIYVPQGSYIKYNMFQNLRPIVLEDTDIQKANVLAKEYKISYDVASLVLFANKKLIPRVFTLDDVSKDLRHKYPRVLFTSPLRNYREDQLQRYIEVQQKKGYTNTEIREVLLAGKWSSQVVKKYLNPENDLKVYIAKKRKEGVSIGEIRKELLDAKWDKGIVDKYVSREEVLKEYITMQRRAGKTNESIRKALLAVGWETTLVTKHLNPVNDLAAYVVAQQHKGKAVEEIKQQLMKAGWKKEVVEQCIKKN